jgi:hypothetical protein
MSVGHHHQIWKGALRPREETGIVIHNEDHFIGNLSLTTQGIHGRDDVWPSALAKGTSNS